MRMVVSKRLYPLLTSMMRVKMDGVQYEVQLSIDVRNQYEHDIELYIDAGEFNYFCYNKENRITCWPTKNGDQPLNEQGQWKKEGRQEMKPGKFINQFIHLLHIQEEGEDEWIEEELDEDVYSKIQARTCEVFADSIRGANTPIDFDISENISSIYGMEPHSTSGHLRSSCMRPGGGYNCSHYASFYETIPDLKIVHKVVSGESLFRALLWTGVKLNGSRTKDEITFLDRIYGSDAINLQMIEYAKSQGWAWRGFESERVRLGEDPKWLDLYLPVPEKSYQYLASQGGPYIDTLCYLSKVNGVWRLSNKCDNYKWMIQECNGDPLEVNQECYGCNNRYPVEELYEVDGNMYCSDCRNERCDICKGCGEEHRDSNMYFCQDNNSYYCEECYNSDEYKFERCKGCGEIHFRENMRQYRRYWYCTGCYNSLEICPVCKTLTDPSEFHRHRVIDNQVFHLICNECLNNVHRCFRCNDRFSGELPLTVDQGWNESEIRHYCNRCIQDSKEQANDPDIRCDGSCNQCIAHGTTCENPYADPIEHKPAEGIVMEVPDELWRQVQNPMVFANAAQYTGVLPVIEIPKAEEVEVVRIEDLPDVSSISELLFRQQILIPNRQR